MLVFCVRRFRRPLGLSRRSLSLSSSKPGQAVLRPAWLPRLQALWAYSGWGEPTAYTSCRGGERHVVLPESRTPGCHAPLAGRPLQDLTCTWEQFLKKWRVIKCSNDGSGAQLFFLTSEPLCRVYSGDSVTLTLPDRSASFTSSAHETVYFLCSKKNYVCSPVICLDVHVLKYY